MKIKKITLYTLSIIIVSLILFNAFSVNAQDKKSLKDISLDLEELNEYSLKENQGSVLIDELDKEKLSNTLLVNSLIIISIIFLLLLLSFIIIKHNSSKKIKTVLGLYTKSLKDKGYSSEKIKNKLKKDGWKKSHIDNFSK